ERLVDRVRPADGARGERIRLYALMLRSYFEAYLLAAKGLLNLPAEGVQRKDWFKRTLAMGQRLYLAGELENRESLAKPKLETALSALRDHGLVTLSAKGALEPPESPAALESFIEQLKRYLR